MSEEGNDNNHAEIKTSKYNSAIAQLYRLDELWKDAHKHSRSGELLKWNWDLDRVWVELAADSSKEDEITFDSYITSIAQCKKEPEKLYGTLLEKEIFLRKLLNKQGKGAAYEDSVDDYMD